MTSRNIFNWPDRTAKILTEMWAAGKTCSEIAERCGTSRHSVQSKARRLGLSRRPSRIKTVATRKDDFAEALAECGDIGQAGAIAGVQFRQASTIFSEIRRGLGWQAK